jgi:hypothetical protein
MLLRLFLILALTVSALAGTFTSDNFQKIDNGMPVFLATVPAASVAVDAVFTFKIKAGANDAILDPNASELIEGASTSLTFTGALESRTIGCLGVGTNVGWWLH